MTFSFTFCGCNSNSSCCQKYSQSHRGENRSQRGGISGSDVGEVYAPITPGLFSRLFTPSLNYDSTDSSSFYHSTKSSGYATKCFLRTLFVHLPWEFLKGSSDEVAFRSNIITHPKAAKGIKRISSRPFPCCKAGIFPRTRSLRCLRMGKISV